MRAPTKSKLPPASSGCRCPSPDLADRARALVTALTREALNDRLGISYNTWRKLVEGRPLRTSVLDRLQARLDLLERPQ
jgi:hypothetical protein